MSSGKKLFRVLLPAAALLFAVNGCGGKSHLVETPEIRRSADEPISPIGYNHFVNANLLEIFGAHGEALREYEKALNFFPNSVTIRTDYARLLFRTSRTPEALEQALQIEPKNSDVYLLIGDCYRLQDILESAAENYRRSIELDPENVNAYWYLAGYYRQIDQPD
jgi:tetratricopeptide (TPR) repeat protein